MQTDVIIHIFKEPPEKKLIPCSKDEVKMGILSMHAQDSL